MSLVIFNPEHYNTARLVGVTSRREIKTSSTDSSILPLFFFKTQKLHASYCLVAGSNLPK